MEQLPVPRRRRWRRCAQSGGGIGIGIALGVALGAAFNDLGAGIAIGAGIGVALDEAMARRNRPEQ